MKEKLGKEIAKEVSDFVNCFGFDKKGFVEQMAREHRTLQQGFTDLCLDWFKHLASLNEGYYDLRNEASVKIAKEIMEKVENAKWGLPTI